MSKFTSAQGLERFTKMLEISGFEVKPHQLKGVEWMLKREQQKSSKAIKGGINADEMGLGKTIMMIGTIICNFKRRTLIVVPFALLDQWETQVLRLTGHAPLVYHGAGRKELDSETVMSSPIVLTTYGHVRDESTPKLLHMIEWDRVVFDEAHHLRNKKKGFEGAEKLQSKIKWLLTGTPIQNKKNDLYALLQLLGYSAAEYSDDLMLGRILLDVLLKRSKEEAGIILPEKHEHVIEVKWQSEEERSLARDVHSRLKFSGVANGLSGSQWAYGKDTLVILLRARQVCVMPELISGGLNSALKEIDEGIAESDDEIDDDESPRIKLNPEIAAREKEGIMKIIENINKISHKGISSKIKAVCDKVVAQKDNGKKKLIFCQFRGEINQMESALKKYDFKVGVVDGRTPGYLREDYLTGTDIDVLILQIQTGCEGLNLQMFSEVYFVTPHWNPSVEDQAVARCHRIGQTEEVDIYRFKMSDFGDHTQTLESHACKVQEKKRELYEMFSEEP